MNKKENIAKQVDEILKMSSKINEVKLSLDFKEKVMQQLFDEKKEKQLFSWFTPKLQFATLVVFILINSTVLFYNAQTNYDAKVNSFAETYNLSKKESILNY